MCAGARRKHLSTGVNDYSEFTLLHSHLCSHVKVELSMRAPRIVHILSKRHRNMDMIVGNNRLSVTDNCDTAAGTRVRPPTAPRPRTAKDIHPDHHNNDTGNVRRPARPAPAAPTVRNPAYLSTESHNPLSSEGATLSPPPLPDQSHVCAEPRTRKQLQVPRDLHSPTRPVVASSPMPNTPPQSEPRPKHRENAAPPESTPSQKHFTIDVRARPPESVEASLTNRVSYS